MSQTTQEKFNELVIAHGLTLRDLREARDELTAAQKEIERLKTVDVADVVNKHRTAEKELEAAQKEIERLTIQEQLEERYVDERDQALAQRDKLREAGRVLLTEYIDQVADHQFDQSIGAVLMDAVLRDTAQEGSEK